MQLLKMSIMNTFSNMGNTSDKMWREKNQNHRATMNQKYAYKYDWK